LYEEEKEIKRERKKGSEMKENAVSVYLTQRINETSQVQRWIFVFLFILLSCATISFFSLNFLVVVFFCHTVL